MDLKLYTKLMMLYLKNVSPTITSLNSPFDTEEVRQNCIDIINMVDEVTVTCDFMKRLYQEKTGLQNITVIPNFVPNGWMGQLYDKDKIISAF